MARNFSRSSSGVRSSSASCNTRSLNASQLSSRLKYRVGNSVTAAFDVMMQSKKRAFRPTAESGSSRAYLDGGQAFVELSDHCRRQRGVVERRRRLLTLVQCPFHEVDEFFALGGV